MKTICLFCKSEVSMPGQNGCYYFAAGYFRKRRGLVTSQNLIEDRPFAEPCHVSMSIIKIGGNTKPVPAEMERV